MCLAPITACIWINWLGTCPQTGASSPKHAPAPTLGLVHGPSPSTSWTAPKLAISSWQTVVSLPLSLTQLSLSLSLLLTQWLHSIRTPDPQLAMQNANAAKKNSSRRNAWGNLSYADLITHAIGSATDKRLTLSQIYEWMVQNVSYFKDKGDSNSSAGWKVSAMILLYFSSSFSSGLLELYWLFDAQVHKQCIMYNVFWKLLVIIKYIVHKN